MVLPSSRLITNELLDNLTFANRVIAAGANFNDAAQRTFELGNATVNLTNVFKSALETGGFVVNATKLAQLVLTLDDLIDKLNSFLDPPNNLQGLFADLSATAKSKAKNPQLVDQTTGVVRSLFDLIADVITS